ncbi:DUF6520 family protein [Flavivirga eckloniae]|uniref:Kazal-like domain-containing protein n=1 Tax=Flavivirga eckloniae TaxID=1803846 RepID=A0A2K9PVF7_9FLAO|nr:DUF6520 family protein [Flavivirga eckloniae]AUP81044.1 hypothetical protein C1H87_20935 [Flavivirga eckloniae]
MKSNFLKTTLPVLVLILAITVSFAFSPAEKSMDQEPVSWLHVEGTCYKIPYAPDCQLEGEEICSAISPNGSMNFYADSNCTVLLYRTK